MSHWIIWTYGLLEAWSNVQSRRKVGTRKVEKQKVESSKVLKVVELCIAGHVSLCQPSFYSFIYLIDT